MITLALAIAAATTIFAIYNATVYRPARTMNSDGVYSVMQPSVLFAHIEPAQLRALRDYPPESLDAVVGRSLSEVVIQHQQQARKTFAEVLDGDFGAVFKTRPVLGRLLDARDDAAGVRSAVISQAVWESWFGNRPGLSGNERIKINGHSFHVVGVMPRAVTSHIASDAWIAAQAALPLRSERERRFNWWTTYVRAKRGVTKEQATTDIAASIRHAPVKSGKEGVRLFGYQRRTMIETQVYGLVGLLLAAACANLTNLVYARMAQRRSEIAVRMALGAGRVRVARTFLLEIALIGGAAALAGYALAYAATQLISSAFPTLRSGGWTTADWSMFRDLRPDLRVAMFAVIASAAVAMALAVLVAWSLGRVPAARSLASNGGSTATGSGGRRFRSALVAIQVTVAVVLVMGAGVWLISARKEIDRTVPFSSARYAAAHLGTFRLDLAYQRYNDTRGAAFHGAILDTVRKVPGVHHAALASGFPGAGRADRNRPSPMYFIVDEGDRVLSGRPPSVQGTYASVSTGFLDTAGLPLIQGRDFGHTDVEGADLVVLVSESIASMLFPKGDAVGRRVIFNHDRKPRTIVGIFRDPLVTRQERWMVAQNILALVPMTQHYRPEVLVLVRSEIPGAAVQASAAAAAALDSDLAIFDIGTLEEVLLAELAPLRAITQALSALGALSLLFAALGIYGVMSFFVSTRVREFGVRMALGASPTNVLRHVFKEARLLLLFGLLCGVFLMAVAERVLDHKIARLMPNAVETWIGAIALVLVSGLIATYFPARRASRTDPTVALREL